jgi:hypothetical protein
MKQEMTITANLFEPGLLTTLVESLASRHVDMGYTTATVPLEWKAIESSCIQAYVLGNFDLHTKGIEIAEKINIPFNGSFLFTCIRDKNAEFNLEWCASLS